MFTILFYLFAGKDVATCIFGTIEDFCRYLYTISFDVLTSKIEYKLT
jgi:hypothetical protein